MTKKIAFLTLGLVLLGQSGWAAPCSRINLTKCLDSACAINMSANPAARCQYCGTADAGLPPSTLRSVSAGASSKNTISAKELKNAPTDPGERYVWATRLCLEKLPNCTTEDVSDTYDSLIEKSCTAAGIVSNMATAQQKAAKNTKTAKMCTNEISVCLTKAEKCDSDFSKCSDDAKFDNFFAACSAQATGCTNFIDKARTDIAETRKSNLDGAKSNLASILMSRRQARLNNLSKVNSNCLNNTDYDNCIKTVCKNNTVDNCKLDTTTNGASDTRIANALCEFHKTACKKIDVLTEAEMQKQLDDLMQDAQKELGL